MKTLQIKNLKCFGSEVETIDFNMPDGKNASSGLNIFVGENNSGKSTIFEGVDFLRDQAQCTWFFAKNMCIQ